MVHVGLHAVATYHKKFGKKNKKNTLSSVQEWHSTKFFLKTLNTVFVECLSVDTRQRCLCRVSDPGHSANSIFKLKKSLSSARDLALGKAGEYYTRRLPLRSFYLKHRRPLR
jgi:hypothetical protein